MAKLSSAMMDRWLSYRKQLRAIAAPTIPSTLSPSPEFRHPVPSIKQASEWGATMLGQTGATKAPAWDSLRMLTKVYSDRLKAGAPPATLITTTPIKVPGGGWGATAPTPTTNAAANDWWLALRAVAAYIDAKSAAVSQSEKWDAAKEGAASSVPVRAASAAADAAKGVAGWGLAALALAALVLLARR